MGVIAQFFSTTSLEQHLKKKKKINDIAQASDFISYKFPKTAAFIKTHRKLAATERERILNYRL